MIPADLLALMATHRLTVWSMGQGTKATWTAQLYRPGPYRLQAGYTTEGVDDNFSPRGYGETAGAALNDALVRWGIIGGTPNPSPADKALQRLAAAIDERLEISA